MAGQYGKGARFENDVKDVLNEGGWFAVRSAGSHGIVDVLSVNINEKWFIQCRKNGNLSGEEREELVKLARKYNAVPILAYEGVVGVSLNSNLKTITKKSIIFEEVKLLKPDFHYEVADGRFVKVDNGEKV